MGLSKLLPYLYLTLSKFRRQSETPLSHLSESLAHDPGQKSEERYKKRRRNTSICVRIVLFTWNNLLPQMAVANRFDNQYYPKFDHVFVTRILSPEVGLNIITDSRRRSKIWLANSTMSNCHQKKQTHTGGTMSRLTHVETPGCHVLRRPPKLSTNCWHLLA